MRDSGILYVMNGNASSDTSKELLTLARQQGYNISSTQLVRWHRAGLLPRPRQQPRKETRGTYSIYPGGTAEQLILLCQLRSTERRFSHLAWQLWLAGYPVDLNLIRTQLAEAASRIAGWMRWFTGFKHIMRAGDSSEEALDLIERYAAGNLHSRILRRIRKRIGRQHFSTFLHIAVRLATEQSFEIAGEGDEYEWLLDLRILALGLGMEKRFVQKKDSLEYYLGHALIPQLCWLLAGLQEVHWEHLLENATSFDLLQVRDELRTWLMQLRNARPFLNQLPNDYPRWDLNASDIFHSLPAPDQALVLVGWLALHLRSASWLYELTFLVPTYSFLQRRGSAVPDL